MRYFRNREKSQQDMQSRSKAYMMQLSLTKKVKNNFRVCNTIPDILIYQVFNG